MNIVNQTQSPSKTFKESRFSAFLDNIFCKYVQFKIVLNNYLDIAIVYKLIQISLGLSLSVRLTNFIFSRFIDFSNYMFYKKVIYGVSTLLCIIMFFLICIEKQLMNFKSKLTDKVKEAIDEIQQNLNKVQESLSTKVNKTHEEQ